MTSPTFRLAEGGHRGIDDMLGPPGKWSILRRSEYVERYTRILHEGEDAIFLRIENGVVVELGRSGDQIVEMTIHEGDSARQKLIEYGLKPSPELRHRVKKAFKTGHLFDECFHGGPPARTVAGPKSWRNAPKREQDLGDKIRRWYVLEHLGGVLEVDVSREERLQRYRWIEGVDALIFYEEL